MYEYPYIAVSIVQQQELFLAERYDGYGPATRKSAVQFCLEWEFEHRKALKMGGYKQIVV